MHSPIEKFRVAPGEKLSLADIDSGFTGPFKSRKEAEEQTKAYLKRLGELQELLYAEHKRALLICLQAMDAGGKDGVINHVMGAMNPQGCRVYSFKKPVGPELDHDFMWRAYRDMPAIGEVAVFNRSHYEDVLAARVHKLAPKSVIAKRYGEINAIEKHLSGNATHIVKFYLHISKDEQLERFGDRLKNESKHWKISASDYAERALWDDYREAFEAMLSKCSTGYAPWFVIPADHKWFRDYAVVRILVDYLEGLHMAMPKPNVDIARIRKEFHKQKHK